MMNIEYEETDGPALDKEQRKYLENFMKTLASIIETCHEPLDAKTLGLLEIAYDIVGQQLKLDVYHEWGSLMELDQAITNEDNGQKFLFLDNDNQEEKDTTTPSAEDLKRWFGE